MKTNLNTNSLKNKLGKQNKLFDIVLDFNPTVIN